MTTTKCIVFFICSLFMVSVSAQEYKLEGNEVRVSKEVKFKFASAELLPESDEALLLIKKYLDDKSYISLLRIEVHTDNAGDAKNNQLLTEKRAEAVSDRLVALGVDCNRLLPVGFGGSKPVAENSTAQGKAQNRRVSFVNAALRGKAIGGMPTDGGGKVAVNPCK